jgi:PHD/YefM family antitoxin component YafN of YafNO toxin-antitoxin module
VFLFENKVLYLQQKTSFINMQVISTREFRANQKKYFDLAAHETIYVARRNEAPILISVAKDEDMLTKAELLSIQRGLDDLKNGRVSRMEKWESLDDFLERTGNV